MATAQPTPEGLLISLDGWEKFGTFQRSFTVDWSHIDRAEASKDLWPQVRGWRAPGIGIPHVILLGRMRFHGGRDFCAIYKDKPGIILEVHDEPYQRLLLSIPPDQARRIVQIVTTGQVPTSP